MSVDFFGLNSYGAAPGGKLAIGGGAVLGGAGQAGAAWAFRKWGGMYKWSEAAGAGAIIAASIPMMFFRKTRVAGVIAALSALGAGVVRTLEIQAGAPAMAGLGLTTMERASAVGMTGAGMGLTTMENAYPVSTGMSGPRDPAQLLGAPVFGDNGLSQNPAAKAAQLLGVPGISGFGARYGATLFGGN